MSRPLTSQSTLDNLKKEAKRWLKAVRANDAEARARLTRAWPGAPDAPGLRDVQHALAREYGFAGWSALKAGLEERGPHSEGAAAAPLAQLIEAASAGDAPRVATLLDANPGIINERGGSGTRTALHFAASARREDVVRILLEHGADPNIRCEGDAATPLHFAAEHGDMGIIRLLIEHGADPVGYGDYHELEVIGWATCFGKGAREVVDYLLTHGARHTIFSAVAVGAVEVIHALAAASPTDLDRRMDLTNHRRRPLHLAVVKQQPRALDALLELGADTEALDESGMTALDQAALMGETAMAERLLERGAKLRLPGAIGLGKTGEIAGLIRGDPDALRPGNRWDRLIVRASERSPGSVIEALIQAGASVEVRDDPKTAVDSTSGYTPLHAAAFFGNADAAAVLLRHGANPSARDDRYCGTPAGWADYAGHTAVRDLILQGPIDLFEAIHYDLTTRIPGILELDRAALDRPFREYATPRPRPDAWWPDPWWTPLAFAILRHKLEAARILVDHGADRALRAPDGRTLPDLVDPEHRDAAAELWKERPTPGSPRGRRA
jgi:ankyrin repeat protein